MVSRSQPDSPDPTVSRLDREGAVRALAGKRGDAERKRLGDVLEHVAEFYSGRSMLDGQPVLDAVVETASLLNELKLDTDTLLVALLSELTAEEWGLLPDSVSPTVAGLTKRVSRVRDVAATGSRVSDQEDHESLRRMLLDVAGDIRAVLVVLAKRLRLLRGLKSCDANLQRTIARQTLAIHAPLANRLGIWQFKWELEDLSLRYLEPATYKEIAQSLDSKRREREDFITAVTGRLGEACAEQDIDADISGRPKHIYSIWKKMRRKRVDFSQIFDVRAVRVLVDTVPECYEVLGMVHGFWPPIGGEFDDYIARPKPNGYRSLHTAVVGEDGMPLEVQVRTRGMHEQAERGVAAHWAYKEARGADVEMERRIAQMKRWLENADGGGASPEPEEELERGSIYVFTPQGKVIELPPDSTPIDFAYAVHTSVGHRCRGARVDGHIRGLTQPLQSGQTVQVITAKEGGPSRDWLNPHAGYLASSRARNRVRHWFKQQDHDEHVQQGRAALDREVTRLGVTRPDLDKLKDRYNFKHAEDLLAAIGRGDLSPIQIAHTQIKEKAEPDPEEVIPVKADRRRASRSKSGKGGQVEIAGVGDLMTQMAKCCKPVPYDPIIGYITQGRGVTVHRANCKVVAKMSDEQRVRLVEVSWAEEPGQSAFMVDVQLLAADRKGLLRDITSVFANEEIDVLGVKTQSSRRDERATMRFTVEVQDVTQLSRVLEKLAQVPDVLDVRRQVS